MSASTSLRVLPPDPPPDPKTKAAGLFKELEEIQKGSGFLSLEQLKKVSEHRGIALSELHGIASYYPVFRTTPPTVKADARVCDDMVCHLRGAPDFQKQLSQRFSGAKDVAIGNVSCLGRCDRAPAFMINDACYESMPFEEAVKAVEQAIHGGIQSETDLVTEKRSFSCDPYQGEQGTYSSLEKFVKGNKTRELKEQELLDLISDAGLCGMGGAGQPTCGKWSHVRAKVPSKEFPDKYIVCNADESEPGTIKDRFILTHLPHLVIEGLILGGFCIGAKEGYFYIRHEYEKQYEIIEAELKRCHDNGWLGKNILETDFCFDIILVKSPGGYICGEETALLEAIEGHRAEPRNRPPRMGDKGLWEMPTVVDNVETLAWVASIANHERGWYAQHGKNGYKGLRFVSVTGDVNNPGVFEVPMGTTYDELIDGPEYGDGIVNAGKLFAFAPSGPSFGYHPVSEEPLHLHWDPPRPKGQRTANLHEHEEKSMAGSGAIVAIAEGRCMLDLALNAVRFFRNESCGKCVPCRLGSQRLFEILERWTKGIRYDSDDQLVEDLFQVLETTSICGLGKSVPKPISTVLNVKEFNDQVKAHFLLGKCPAGVCSTGPRS